KKGKLKSKIDLKTQILKSQSLFNKLTKAKFYKKIFKEFKKLNDKNTTTKVSVYILLVFFIILGDKFLIEYLVKSSFYKLENIEKVSSFNELEDDINDAKINLIFADIFFKPFSIIPNREIKNANAAISVGKESSILLGELLKQYNSVKNQLLENTSEEIYKSEILEEKLVYLEEIEFKLDTILSKIDKISLNPNDENYSKIERFKIKLLDLKTKVNYLNNNSEKLLSLLGHYNTKKYFLVFQNNDEIRPTGGFMGSAAILELFRGDVKSFEKKDIYAYEWVIDKNYKEKRQAPKGLDQISDIFHLRDANYYLDYNSSSSSINYFLNKGGYDIDGIVYINMNSVLKILEKTGGIYFEEIDETITSENFSEIFSILVEAKTYKTGTLGTPKQILFDFAKILEEKILNDGNLGAYLKIIFDEIKNRELVIHSFSKLENELLMKLDLSGENNLNETLDFAYPVFTSVGGNKTDRYIERTYEKYITQNNDCSIDTNLKISLHHNYTNTDKQRIIDLMNKHNIEATDKLLNIQGNGTNKQFIRVLLPKDAEIQGFNGATIKQFNSTSYIDFYMYTNPGETKTYDIKYTIKNSECRKYDFKFHKQSGINRYNISIGDKSGINEYNNVTTDFNYNKR
ncbi:MAG: DUF4012 domain-containing protein, partial [Candidatus Gracilibacteria bacterium]|nr:DUF4012 domain-containing protein [Candidatus Gracilibacteria bacterium]